MKPKWTLATLVAAIAFTSPAAEQPDIVTNLNDRLCTRVSVPRSTNIDTLSWFSDLVDKDKEMHTSLADMTVTDMSVRELSVPRVVVAVPMEDHIRDSIRRLLPRVIAGRPISPNDITIWDLSPNAISWTSFDLTPVSRVTGWTPALDCTKLHIDVTEDTVRDLSPNAISWTSFDLTPVSRVTGWTGINVFSRIPVLDCTKLHIDVTEDTVRELEEIGRIYKFEKSYNSHKGQIRLKDMKRLGRDEYARWIEVLSSNKTCNIEFLENYRPRKIVGEAWIIDGKYGPEDRKNLVRNLLGLKTMGYNAVLVRFDCTEDIVQLTSLLDDIRNAGLEIFSTYVGRDYQNPRWNPFIDPETLEGYFSVVVPRCTGIFLNWRGTSNHVALFPAEFFNYICNMSRKINPDILIYGEIYYGKIDPLRTEGVIFTIPRNVTGIVINNMGYYGYNIRYVVNGLFTQVCPGYRKLDKIGQVIGYGPYYCSRPDYHAHLGLGSEFRYKKYVEDEFGKTGSGTVTMLHDGVDDNQTDMLSDGSRATYPTTDNIVYDTKVGSLFKTNQTQGTQK